MSKQARILFIDAYDSFSNNIITLLKTELPVLVEVIKIDDPRFVLNDDAFFDFLDHFDAVVAGPGPGHPANLEDAGLIAKLWTLPDERLIPVLGICFGFQSLALHFGATIERLKEPRHGIITPVFHCGRDIFAKTGQIMATRYHSLCVHLGQGESRRGRRNLWLPWKSSKELLPLAWDVTDKANGEILMAVKHCHNPFWGVQYHPESICTNEEGRKLIINWAFEALIWKSSRPNQTYSIESNLSAIVEPKATKNRVVHTSVKDPHPKVVQWRMIDLKRHMTIPRLVDLMRNAHAEPILFESGIRNGRPVNEETGRFSIIGVHDSSSTHIQYSTKSHRMDVVSGGDILISQALTVSDMFNFLHNFMNEHIAVDGPPNVAFWGGLIGFISYEAGLETINVAPPTISGEQPDVWFVFVERSIVIDHVENVVYIQSIREDDGAWLTSIEKMLQHAVTEEHGNKRGPVSDATVISSPHGHEYRQKVRQCQDHLRAGSSYELCLTDTTFLQTEAAPWQIYLRLRETNPAPFGAYLHLPSSSLSNAASTQGISIISSSPERFLSWSRKGECQFRPIKGTVKKASGIDRAKAEELLQSPKERAENLMIVDLIRHDLNGVKGVRDVRVPKLMSVEEYEAVFQLVSVIEGHLVEGSGISVLQASLPPGSMTGAPKKRSCELLKEVENQRARGLYSGVIGYLDVGGGGDFSVVIRTAYKWSGDAEWRVGAGGAVTAMSDPEAEWQEMKTKRGSALRAFGEGIRI